MAIKKIGAGIALDGEKEFKKAISGINKDLKVLSSEMGKVTAEFAGNAKSTTALTAKQKVLNKQIDEQKNKVTKLQEALANSSKEFGENDNKTKDWQISLNRATAELSKMEGELRRTEAALNAGSASVQKYEEQAKKLQALGNTMTDVGKKMSMAITAPLVAASAVSFKLAADLEDAMGATDQIYGRSSEEMKRWAQSLESYYGIARNEALEYGNMMGSMLQNIGELTEKEAAKQAQTLIELAGDLRAMYGGTTADAVRALTGALKGNNTMLDNYGMAVNDAMVKTKALELGMYSGTGQMSLAAKQAATLALIMEQTGAAQGQAGREAEGASGSMTSLTTELKNLSISIGEVLLPVITPMIAKLNEMIKSFNELSPTTKTTIVTIAGLAAALGPVLLIGGQIVSVIGTFNGALAILHGSTMVATPAMQGLATVMKVFTGTTAASTAATTASTAATTASTLATKLATVAQGAFNLVLKASPVFWAVAGIVALGVAVYNIIKYWKDITAWIGKAWDALTKFTKASPNVNRRLEMELPSNLRNTTRGYASGTQSAAAGWHWVGERGPELVNFRGGEKVLSNNESMGTVSPQPVNITLAIDGKVLARHIYDPLNNEGRIRGAVLGT